MAFSLASSISLGVLAATRGLTPQEIQATLIEWAHSTVGMVLSASYGFGFTFLGGHIAAKASGADHLLNSAMVGVLGILIGLFFVSETPREILLLSILLSVPVSMLGGFYYTRRWKLV
jgi:uncharacterized protein (DUF697 family)